MRLRVSRSDVVFSITTVALALLAFFSVWSVKTQYDKKPPPPPKTYSIFVKTHNGNVSMIENLTEKKCQQIYDMIYTPDGDNLELINATHIPSDVIWVTCFNTEE